MISWNFSSWNSISLNDFHDMIALRIAVFVVEQNCPYPELDGKDKKADFVFGRNASGEMVACARILPAGISYPEVSIGRVANAASVRGTGAGKELMRETMQHIESLYGKVPIRISAQEYLLQFYRSFGFKPVSESYLEDDIPHVEMLYLPA